MKNLKILLTAAVVVLASSTGCTKKENEADRYFRFKANGVQYDYEYECETGWTGTSTCSFGAFQSTSTAWGGTYQIYGSSFKNKAARGEIRFFLNKEDFNTKDTIILDGVRNRASVLYLNDGITTNNYGMFEPLSGIIIFEIKEQGVLKGNFHFKAYKYFMNEITGHSELSDTIVKFSDGVFQVGRLN